jgi:glyoxylase-like metal-dependent hydrolase (beta-lactamase superfamily II)
MVLLLTLGLASPARADEEDLSQAEVKASRVAGNVYMVEGPAGNIGAQVGDDGIVIVDDQFALLAPKIRAALRKFCDKPIRFVINTHWHPDHTDGNVAFGSGSAIIAHDNTRKRLAAGGWILLDGKVEPAPHEALPVITFADAVTVHLNGDDVYALHVPHGHTDGDAVIFFPKANVVHMGDDFFNGLFPFIDVHNGGSLRGFIAGIEKLLPRIPPGAKLIPGHGPVGTVEDLRRFLAMVKETTAVVEAAIAKGQSLEQMKRGRLLAPWKKWEWPVVDSDTYLQILDGELRKR